MSSQFVARQNKWIKRCRAVNAVAAAVVTLKGNLGAEQPQGTTSIHPSFRKALLHVISSEGGWSPEKFQAYYMLGSKNHLSIECFRQCIICR